MVTIDYLKNMIKKYICKVTRVGRRSLSIVILVGPVAELKIRESQKLGIKKQILFLISLFLLIPSYALAQPAQEVPFEVIKTKMTAVRTVPMETEMIVIDGEVIDPSSNYLDGEYWGETHKGEYDHRIKVPITGIRYTLTFWNVGAMGGEKGFVFKSNYSDAKLTISYIRGQAYKMESTGEGLGDWQIQEKKEVSTPSINSMSYNLHFSGGPFGTFVLMEKDRPAYEVGNVSTGESVSLGNFGVTKNLVYTHDATLKIQGDGFEKWMEIISSTDSDCSDPKNSKTDSNIRFSDFQGEVMVRPCIDQDAWYGAELDIVLHVEDHIKTGEDSMALLSLQDMTSFRMKPESEIVLTVAPNKESKINLIWGKVKANVKKMLKDGTWEVEMSQAVCGIKGTIFVVEETGAESTLKVIEGIVEFTSKSTGEKEMIVSGESITATSDGLQEKIFFEIENENKQWDLIQEKLDADKSENTINNKTKNNTVQSSRNYMYWILLLFIVIIGFFVIKKIKK